MSISRPEAYELLQVAPGATEDEIKSSYRRLALKYHPDKNKDDDQAKATFQRINAAYHLLTSDQEINTLSEDQIATLFQHLIRSELFSFLSRTFSFSEDESDYYDTEEECMNCEQWQKIEKKAQENAKQLVQEEEQEKKKLEKKRERRKKHKQRRKEKKREEKDLTKGDENTDKYEIKEVSDFPQPKPKQEAPVTIKKQKQKEPRKEPASSDSDQPDIDLGSAFCSKVKQKVEKERSRKASEKEGSRKESPTTEPDIKPEPQSTRNGHAETKQPVINHKTEPKQKQYVQPNPPNEEEFFKSQEHARKGNELAQFGKLHNAIEEYTQAIQLNKTDHRCYGNRSYCYHLLKKYEEALSDSDNAVRLVPNEPKGYFRKAKALCGLKRFSEAESALKKILELDAGCEEARHELFEVRMLQLQDFGFDRRACEHALMKAKGDIQAAIEFLLSSQVKDNMSFGTSDTSDNEQPVHHNHNGPKPQTQQFQSYFPVVPPGSYTTSPLRMPLPTPPPGRPPLIPPFQPVQNVQFTTRPPPQMTPAVQSMPPKMPVRKETTKRKFDPRDYSLWIGHFDSKKVSEKDLYDVFAKYGKVSGVVIIKTHGKPLAYSFIHFMKHDDAKRAYNAAQNHVIQGVSLDVNWNKNPTIECEHWLRGHCPYNNCHYLHVVDHHHR